MLTKSFFGFVRPVFRHESLTQELPRLVEVPSPPKATLLLESPFDQLDPTLLKVGDTIKPGQKLKANGNGSGYAIATLPGKVTSLQGLTGDFGHTYTAVTIEAGEAGEGEQDGVPYEGDTLTPSLDVATNYLQSLPGAPPMERFANEDKPISTIVIYCGDSDLLITTNQFVVRTEMEAIQEGIAALKSITGVEDVILAIPGEMMQGYGHIGATVKMVNTTYPAAFPKMIMKDVLGQVVPAGRTCEDLGVCFITAEAVAAIGKAFTQGWLPNRKIISVVDKSGHIKMVSAVIGTPVGAIFDILKITVQDGDRIIIGGPMTGSAIFSLDHPVTPTTGALLVQDAKDIIHIADYPCINCGECVRICPVDIPVNMLVRYLAAGQYEAAADQYDLYSCIECGLCAYVCVSKIPIFQYIRLGHYELDRTSQAEAAND
jgi:electron transport complex protein RnfC